MKINLYLAISIDGYIAKTDGNSDWIGEADFPIFDEMIEQSNAIIIGNSTFQQFRGEIYPIKNIKNIIITSQNFSDEENVIFKKTPFSAIEYCESEKFKNIIIVGGGRIAGSFLKENLIDEIIIDVQPVILGKGIKLFEDIETFVELDFMEHISLQGGLNILKYKVKK